MGVWRKYVNSWTKIFSIKYIVKYLTDLLNNESPQNSWLTNIDEITIFRALLESADDSDFVETALQPAPALTWRTIGGVLDLYMFMGPSPSEVIQQYTEVIGRSFMPPYWSLGFHLCKFGYHSVNETMAVVKRMQEAKIPQVCLCLSLAIFLHWMQTLEYFYYMFTKNAIHLILIEWSLLLHKK